jgi:hypothetical protein
LFVRHARYGTIDTTLTLLLFLAIYGYIRLNNRDQKWWHLIWISFGLAVMAKGFGGLIIPPVITLALLLDRKVLFTLRSREFWQGLVIALVIAAPWYVITYIRYGQTFIDEHVIEQTFGRVATALDTHVGGPFFYLNSLRRFFSPWLYLIPFAIALSVKENVEGQRRSRLLLILVIMVFGLYTIVRTKLPWYILPIYPALAILIASTITQAFKTPRSIGFIGLVVATFGAVLIARNQLILLFGCVGSFVILFFILTKRDLAYRAAVIVICIFLFSTGFSTIIGKSRLGTSPLYGRGMSPAATIARLVGNTSLDSRAPLISLAVGTVDTVEGPALLFYSNRPTQAAYTLDELAVFTSSQKEQEIILPEEMMQSLSTDYEFQVLAKVEPFVYATIKKRMQQ